MERKVVDKLGDWQITLNRNVHMYSHVLLLRSKNHSLEIPCEDLAMEEKTIGIWLYPLDESKELITELANVLTNWSKKFDTNFRIYTNETDFLTNKQRV